jgi:hypothetical protein
VTPSAGISPEEPIRRLKQRVIFNEVCLSLLYLKTQNDLAEKAAYFSLAFNDLVYFCNVFYGWFSEDS